MDSVMRATVGIGLVKVVFIVVAVFVVDRHGRRPVLMVSGAAIGVNSQAAHAPPPRLITGSVSGPAVAQAMIALSFALGSHFGLALAGQTLFMVGTRGWGAG